jgi:hypothetical protein
VGKQNAIGCCNSSVVELQFTAPEKSRQQRDCVVDCANAENVEITVAAVAATSIAILIIDGLPDLIGAGASDRADCVRVDGQHQRHAQRGSAASSPVGDVR